MINIGLADPTAMMLDEELTMKTKTVLCPSNCGVKYTNALLLLTSDTSTISGADGTLRKVVVVVDVVVLVLLLNTIELLGADKGDEPIELKARIV